MSLDDEPVIISVKDFTPTPSSSPAPSIGEEEKSKTPASKSNYIHDVVVDAEGYGADTEDLNSSAIVSDNDEDEEGNNITGSSMKKFMDASTTLTTTTKSTDVRFLPTPEDVIAVEELGLSLSDMPSLTTSSSIPPSARQIVSIGTESDSYAFTFHEEELNAILRRIPAGWKVCVVSVVGAFRTGKSFLLSWFLRYLEAHCVQRDGTTARMGMGSQHSESDDGKKWYERVQTLNQHEGSFDWRGGKERNTTGMWMWSDPYFLPRPSTGDQVAVLLVDTQGMFDHETTVGLTAAIFGLSTLLSSYQVYNVDKRIQEDNLQQLALFSEYGRIAFEVEEKAATKDELEECREKSAGATEDEKKSSAKQQPFQRIEFLVRDWQNFDTEDETDIASMEAEMDAYLEHVTAEREASDLKATRDQITSCFEEIGCFMMTHPGFGVIKNKYEGDVSKIEPLFMRLLDRYCHRVFNTTGVGATGNSSPTLKPKTVRGRELSAVELGTYIKSYAQMFEEIGAHFPKAETMLEATSKANNANAVNASVDVYTDLMNVVAGPHVNDYHRPNELLAKHQEASSKAMSAFDDIANFGNRKAIEEARAKVLQKITKDYDVFMSMNDGRNPLLGFETYVWISLISLLVA
jgi:atlastin